MGRWGDGSDDDGVDAFGDAIKEEVPIVYGSLADLRLNTARQQADEAGAAAAGGGALAPTASSTASDPAVATSGSVSGSMSPGREAAVAAGSAYASLDLSIPHHKLVTPGGDRRRSHVVYIVQCQGPERAWQVRKRFSEFHALHASLVEANARHVPPFPSKMKRFMESEEALAKRRMAQLQEYLVAVGALAAKGRLRVAPLDSFLREERRDGAVGAVVPPQDLEGSSRHASPREYEQDEEGFVKLTATAWTPYTTVIERPTEHLIVLDVPGMDRSQLQLAVLDNGVRVYGERTLDIANSNIVHNDRAFGSFAIDFIIPEQYAPYTNVTTDLKRGCLYVTLRIPGAGEGGSPGALPTPASSPPTSSHHGSSSPGHTSSRDTPRDPSAVPAQHTSA